MNYWSTLSAVIVGIALRDLIHLGTDYYYRYRNSKYLDDLLERIEDVMTLDALDEESNSKPVKKATKKK